METNMETTNGIEVVEITWEQILPIWTKLLWPGRKSKIKSINSIKLMGGYDKEIEKNIPTFFGVFVGEECIGVNSGFATSETQYRSRGLYVKEEWRGVGIAGMLLRAVEEQAIKEGI